MAWAIRSDDMTSVQVAQAIAAETGLCRPEIRMTIEMMALAANRLGEAFPCFIPHS